MKTVNDFIKELQALRPDLRELPIVVTAKNGEQFEAKAKPQVKNMLDFVVDKVVVTYE